MSFSWSDYLNVAEHLVEYSQQSSYEEGCLRAAISRAYYAALNTSRDLLQNQWGINVPTDASIHKFIPQCFRDEDKPERKEIGMVLDRLRDRRRKADYSDEISKPRSLARNSLADAQFVIERLSTL
mgnify:CR=1 FL=1